MQYLAGKCTSFSRLQPEVGNEMTIPSLDGSITRGLATQSARRYDGLPRQLMPAILQRSHTDGSAELPHGRRVNLQGVHCWAMSNGRRVQQTPFRMEPADRAMQSVLLDVSIAVECSLARLHELLFLYPQAGYDRQETRVRIVESITDTLRFIQEVSIEGPPWIAASSHHQAARLPASHSTFCRGFPAIPVSRLSFRS